MGRPSYLSPVIILVFSVMFSLPVYDYLLPSMTVDRSLPDTVVEVEIQRPAKSLTLTKMPQPQEIFDFSYVREASRALAQK